MTCTPLYQIPTPGSWRINGRQILAYHRDAEGDHETLIADLFEQHPWHRANARLIAAAPQLRDALERLFNILHDYEDSRRKGYLRQAMQQAKDALAHARTFPATPV